MNKTLLSKCVAVAALLSGGTTAMATTTPNASVLETQSGANEEYYYYYNVGQGKFLTAGGAWDSQAVLGETSTVYFTPVDISYDAVTVNGTSYQPYAVWGAKALFTTNSDSKIGSGVNAVFTDGSGKGDAEYWAFQEVDVTNHYYAIIANQALLEGSVYYLGYDATTNSEYPGVYWTATNISDNEKWILVSKTDYEAFVGQSASKTYTADVFCTLAANGSNIGALNGTTFETGASTASNFILFQKEASSQYYYVYDPATGYFLTDAEGTASLTASAIDITAFTVTITETSTTSDIYALPTGLYNIYNYGRWKYVQEDVDDNGCITTAGSDASTPGTFIIYPDPNNSGKYYIYATTLKKFISQPESTENNGYWTYSETPASVTITNGISQGISSEWYPIAPMYRIGDDSAPLANDFSGTMQTWTSTDDKNCHWRFDRIEGTATMPVSISAESGIETFCCPFALDFSSTASIKAYTAAFDGSAINTTNVEQVPAQTGIIIYSESGATSEDVPLAASADALSGNELTGVLESTTVTYDESAGNHYYTLYNAAFYKANNTTVAAGKAYMASATVASSNAKIQINIGDKATGISQVNAATANSAAYNLAGQKVNGTYKGIVIKNGKKYNK